MQSITSEKVIEVLKMIFATHGLPRKVVTDNGPSFTSTEFQDFMSSNGVKLVHSAPYHPSTNGLAQRAVQSFKQAIKRIPGASVQERLSKYLFKYRITPHTTTGISPAEMLMGRRPRSKLDLLYPTIPSKVERQQERQKSCHDRSPVLRAFSVTDTVFVKNFSGVPPRWLPGKVLRVTGPLSYEVELLDGHIVRRHVDAVKSRTMEEISPDASEHTDEVEELEGEDSGISDDFIPLDPAPAEEPPVPAEHHPPVPPRHRPPVPPRHRPPVPPRQHPPVPLRRSSRVIHAPERLC